jgi:gas vesicle protein
MRKTLSFLIGVVAGALVGAVVAILLAPASGSELQEQIRNRVQALIEEGKKAAAARQEELAVQLDAFKRGAPVVIESGPVQPQA